MSSPLASFTRRGVIPSALLATTPRAGELDATVARPSRLGVPAADGEEGLNNGRRLGALGIVSSCVSSAMAASSDVGYESGGEDMVIVEKNALANEERIQTPGSAPMPSPLQSLRVFKRIRPVSMSSTSLLSTFLALNRSKYLEALNDGRGQNWTVVAGNEAGGMCSLVLREIHAKTWSTCRS